MLLKEVGRSNPLVVVFTAMCMGILVFTRDLPFVLFCLFFLVLLFNKNILQQIFAGVLLSLFAVLLAPHPADIPDGGHHIEGIVQETGFMRGTFRIVLGDVLVDQTRIRGQAVLNVYRNSHRLEKGCRVSGPVQLKAPRGYGNRGEFDYRKYLLTQGITMTGHIKDFDSMKVVRAGKKHGIKDIVTSAFSLYARPEAEILNAVLTGDRSGLAYSLQDSFTSLGIAHLIAISGLNMGIVFLMGYLAAFMVLRCIPPVARRFDTPLIAKIAGIICVISYTIFVGYSAPAMRSGIMTVSLVVCLLTARKPSLIESLALSGIIILSWMPYSLYSVSFLLSFAAVLGLIGLYERFAASRGRLLLILVPIVGTAFTAPIVMYAFGFVSPVSILANIVFVPWFSFIIMPLGITGLLCMMISESLSGIFLTLAFDGIGLILKASRIFGTTKPVACPPIVWVIICYAGLITAFFSKRSALRFVLITTCVVLISVIPAGLQVIRHREPLCFDFISVGQGDSILVTKGGKTVLIDAGGSFSGSDTGRFIVGPRLLRRGITGIDLAVMTHSHPDHIGGMPFIMSRFPVKKVWTNVRSDWNPEFRSVMRIAEEKSIPVENVCLGDVLHVGGMRIEVLNPPKRLGERTKSLDLNLYSVVLRIGEDNMKGLFMADAADLADIRLSRLEEDISAHILKAGHHGSKKSCLNMLLDRVRPEIAVISVGARNIYRLPHKSVLDRLRDRGIAVYRTDLEGGIMVCLKKGSFLVKSGRTSSDIFSDTVFLFME